MAVTTGSLNTFSTVAGYGGDIKDPNGVNLYASGGNSNMLNITGPQVVKAAPGRIAKFVVLGVVGTGGSITINDATTVAGATTANQIYTNTGTLAVGSVINLDFPCLNGIVISAVPTGGTVQLAVSFN
jgi:hypothetical protein